MFAGWATQHDTLGRLALASASLAPESRPSFLLWSHSCPGGSSGTVALGPSVPCRPVWFLQLLAEVLLRVGLLSSVSESERVLAPRPPPPEVARDGSAWCSQVLPCVWCTHTHAVCLWCTYTCHVHAHGQRRRPCPVQFSSWAVVLVALTCLLGISLFLGPPLTQIQPPPPHPPSWSVTLSPALCTKQAALSPASALRDPRSPVMLTTGRGLVLGWRCY